MPLPYMKTEARRSQKQMISFYGINYSQNVKDGELSESEGLSSAQFPCLSQRDGRKKQGSYQNPTGLYARGKLCVVDGTDFIYGDKVVGKVSEGEKHIATINTKIVIFPDKVCYDTESDEFSNLEVNCSCYPGDVSFQSNSLTVLGTSYADIAKEEEGTLSAIPADTSFSAYTAVSIDKASGKVTLSNLSIKTPDRLQEGDLIQYGCDKEKEYMAVQWTKEGPDGGYQIGFILHTATLQRYADLEELFAVGDGVDISGCADLTKNNGSHIIRSISGRTLTFDKDIFDSGTDSGTVVIQRKVPDLSCICECDNRIWGAQGTTIYASALGDPKNFYVYDGLSTDSYAVAVGTDGDFSGCVAYSSTVLFWKENCVHKVMGSYPAQYEIYTYTVPGVQKGSEKSLCVINETLFYKGREGVYAYTGGVPELISECFGIRQFQDAVAGSDGSRYYISMRDVKLGWSLYVFDPLRNIWLREDQTHAADFAQLDGILYYLDADSGQVMATGQDSSEEGLIPWSATFCQMDEVVHGRKGYSRLYLRADLEAGAWLKVEVSADGAPFRQVFAGHNERAKTVQIPILPTRCDNFRIRLSGKGSCILKSLVREFTIGSEV
ncbi:MAG: hypothetical protein DBY45_01810 [Clostridiales bacterium]|nr:MAG: hypothetical protein DBY45_01810 [Clostridiales bacterium]